MQISVNQNLQSAYDQQYKNEVAGWRELGAIQKTKNILDISRGLTFQKVLEVGAGDGSILQNLSTHNFAPELYAVEISESGLANIKARNIKNLQEAQLFDGYQIPYPDKHFDLVILTHVLEHVEYERLILREIKRVSKYQIIEVPKDYRFGVDKKVKHFLSYGHINLYTPSSLKFLVQAEGFGILKELNRLYAQETFTFGKKSFPQKMKANLTYWAKKILSSTPFTSLNQHYINTITLLLKAEEEGIHIF